MIKFMIAIVDVSIEPEPGNPVSDLRQCSRDLILYSSPVLSDLRVSV
jgi:hypothetical protein